MNRIYILYDVLKDWNLTQKYGKTKYAKDNPGYYTNGVHKGWDYGEALGKPIPSHLNGIIIKIERHIKYNDKNEPIGKGLMVVVWDPIQLVAIRYCHLSYINVEIGQHINAGDIIGTVGNTGFSKGSHLHIEIVETDKNANALNKNNKYKGCIDPGGSKIIYTDLSAA